MTRWAEVPGDARPARLPEEAVDGLVPAAVVRPASVALVQECVRAVAARAGSLVASGLGAHLAIGARPRRLDVLLRLDRLDRVLDHQASDMTITVEAGCPLPALAGTLAAAGQWLPLDPPRPEATTVGGLLAANLSGPLRASQGSARDYLIGIRTVAADGAVVAGGGRVVKNVAGYDLPKLHVGALGTVGVIVEATFKVRPGPADEEAVVISCPTIAAAARAARAVLDGDAPPFWLEIGAAADLAAGPGDGVAVAVGLAGRAEEIAFGRERVLAAAAALGLDAVAVEGGAALRTRLAGFAAEPAAAVLRLATLPADVGRVMEAVEAAGAHLRCLASAANGVVRVAVPEAGAAVALVRALRPEAEARGGSLVVERAVPAVKAELDVWGDPGAGLPLMRRLKAAFDPGGLFAPGRFVGGI